MSRLYEYMEGKRTSVCIGGVYVLSSWMQNWPVIVLIICRCLVNFIPMEILQFMKPLFVWHRFGPWSLYIPQVIVMMCFLVFVPLKSFNSCSDDPVFSTQMRWIYKYPYLSFYSSFENLKGSEIFVSLEISLHPCSKSLWILYGSVISEF